MSTTRILLTLEDAVLPSANPAVLTKITSSATATTNTPKPTYNQLQFDQSTDQSAIWTLRLPSDWVSGMSLFVKLGCAVNAGNVVMDGGIAPNTDSSTNTTAGVFTACDVSATTAVPGTVGQVLELSWSLTTTGVAAGRLISVFLGRRASIAADTAAGTAYVLAAELEYTS